MMPMIASTAMAGAYSTTAIGAIGIAVGIGSLRMQNNKIVESQGEAFELSGRELDAMTKESMELSIKTPWSEINEELKVHCLFADSTINNWSARTAESVYRYLLLNETQDQQAAHFKISQPAIGKRLMNQGNMKAMDAFIRRFQNLIVQQTNPAQNGI